MKCKINLACSPVQDNERIMRVRVTLLSDPNEILHSKLRQAEVMDEGGGTVEGTPTQCDPNVKVEIP